MPRHRTAELCRFPLPTGQYCRQIALKDAPLCRHHWRLYLRSQAETDREDAIEQLEAKLQSLDLPNLLHVLSGILARLRPTVRVPEARLALAMTIERLGIDQNRPT